MCALRRKRQVLHVSLLMQVQDPELSNIARDVLGIDVIVWGNRKTKFNGKSVIPGLVTTQYPQVRRPCCLLASWNCCA
jgi:hypothetical protein